MPNPIKRIIKLNIRLTLVHCSVLAFYVHLTLTRETEVVNMM